MRKNDLAYLQDLKIDIQTDNDNSYQELAIFFDKPRVLEILQIMRKTYGIQELGDISNYEEIFDADYCPRGYETDIEANSIDFSKYSKFEQIKKTFPDFCKRIEGSDIEIVFLEAECYLLCYEFSRQSNFFEAIKRALFCGAVDKNAFKSTQALVVDRDNMLNELSLPSLAIYISPSSTYEDLKEEFRRAKKLMESDKRFSYFKTRADFVPNIRKYRDWYWQYIKGDTYQKISDNWIEAHKDQELNTSYLDVLKAVKTYKKLLEL